MGSAISQAFSTVKTPPDATSRARRRSSAMSALKSMAVAMAARLLRAFADGLHQAIATSA